MKFIYEKHPVSSLNPIFITEHSFWMIPFVIFTFVAFNKYVSLTDIFF